uniref:HMG box protein n=1 Tax=Pyrenopeziza brassicae TaxID=76659 RepID=O93941_PYRBR|nr:HMG box protein [Pyrenopeziza brassicae]
MEVASSSVLPTTLRLWFKPGSRWLPLKSARSAPSYSPCLLNNTEDCLLRSSMRCVAESGKFSTSSALRTLANSCSMIANIDEAVKTVLLDDVHRVAVGPDSLFATKGVDDAEGLPIVDHGSVFCSSVTEIDIDCIPGSQLARSIQDDHSVLQAYLLAANSGGATSFFPAPATNASRRVGRNVIARPPNCFILFRQAMHAAVVAANPGVHNNVISRLISGMWRESPPEIIEHYKALAELAKARHLHLYPNYRFTPRKSSDKKRRMTKKKAAALELATALAASVAGRVLPTDAVTRGEVVDHNASVGQANMEPQGSALGLEMVNGAALLQDEDITAASGAFVPREDFTVHITADHPDEIILDQAVADARQASAFADYHHNFRYHYEQLNGTMAPEISNYDAVINEAYVYDPPHYDAELNGLFFANE